MSQEDYRSISAEETPLTGASAKSAGLFRQYASLRLENSGAVARDHMANERTFLAWLRTSLSLVTIGIGIVQLLKLKNESEDLSRYAKPLGASFVFIGIMTLVMGTLRYFRVQTMLLSSYYPASQFSVTFLVGTVFLLVVVTLGSLFLA
ncbi:hypothetical protein OXX80_000082 [Metschnikowia pulcherrima]